MTFDEAFIEKIYTMNKSELLELIIEHPEYLCDGYYREFGVAITQRHKELTVLGAGE